MTFTEVDDVAALAATSPTEATAGNLGSIKLWYGSPSRHTRPAGPGAPPLATFEQRSACADLSRTFTTSQTRVATRVCSSVLLQGRLWRPKEAL